MTNHTTDFGRGPDYSKPIQPGYSAAQAQLMESVIAARIAPKVKKKPMRKITKSSLEAGKISKNKMLAILEFGPALAEDLAAEAGLAVSYTRKKLRELSKQGLVKITRNRSEYRQNYYTLVRRKC